MEAKSQLHGSPKALKLKPQIPNPYSLIPKPHNSESLSEVSKSQQQAAQGASLLWPGHGDDQGGEQQQHTCHGSSLPQNYHQACPASRLEMAGCIGIQGVNIRTRVSGLGFGDWGLVVSYTITVRWDTLSNYSVLCN